MRSVTQTQPSLKASSAPKLNLSIIIRSTLFNFLMATLIVFFGITGLFIFWTPFRVRYAYISCWSKSTIWLAKVLCGIKYEIEGFENIEHQHAIAVCNHQSTWETLFLQVLLGPQSWVLKRELLWIPFFGWGLGLLEPIAINRAKKGSIKFVVKKGIEKLNDKRWVVIFPQGTRVKPGEKKRFSRGAAVLSQGSKQPVVPIAHNAGIVWPKNSFFKYPGTISVKIGKAIYPKDEPPENMTEHLQRWFDEQLDTMPH